MMRSKSSRKRPKMDAKWGFPFKDLSGGRFGIEIEDTSGELISLAVAKKNIVNQLNEKYGKKEKIDLFQIGELSELDIRLLIYRKIMDNQDSWERMLGHDSELWEHSWYKAGYVLMRKRRLDVEPTIDVGENPVLRYGIVTTSDEGQITFDPRQNAYANMELTDNLQDAFSAWRARKLNNGKGKKTTIVAFEVSGGRLQFIEQNSLCEADYKFGDARHLVKNYVGLEKSPDGVDFKDIPCNVLGFYEHGQMSFNKGTEAFDDKNSRQMNREVSAFEERIVEEKERLAREIQVLQEKEERLAREMKEREEKVQENQELDVIQIEIQLPQNQKIRFPKLKRDEGLDFIAARDVTVLGPKTDDAPNNLDLLEQGQVEYLDSVIGGALLDLCDQLEKEQCEALLKGIFSLENPNDAAIDQLATDFNLTPAQKISIKLIAPRYHLFDHERDEMEGICPLSNEMAVLDENRDSRWKKGFRAFVQIICDDISLGDLDVLELVDPDNALSITFRVPFVPEDKITLDGLKSPFLVQEVKEKLAEKIKEKTGDQNPKLTFKDIRILYDGKDVREGIFDLSIYQEQQLNVIFQTQPDFDHLQTCVINNPCLRYLIYLGSDPFNPCAQLDLVTCAKSLEAARIALHNRVVEDGGNANKQTSIVLVEISRDIQSVPMTDPKLFCHENVDPNNKIQLKEEQLETYLMDGFSINILGFFDKVDGVFKKCTEPYSQKVANDLNDILLKVGNKLINELDGKINADELNELAQGKSTQESLNDAGVRLDDNASTIKVVVLDLQGTAATIGFLDKKNHRVITQAEIVEDEKLPEERRSLLNYIQRNDLEIVPIVNGLTQEQTVAQLNQLKEQGVHLYFATAEDKLEPGMMSHAVARRKKIPISENCTINWKRLEDENFGNGLGIEAKNKNPMLRYIMEKEGVDMNEIFYLDDGDTNITAAHELGVYCKQVNVPRDLTEGLDWAIINSKKIQKESLAFFEPKEKHVRGSQEHKPINNIQIVDLEDQFLFVDLSRKQKEFVISEANKVGKEAEMYWAEKGVTAKRKILLEYEKQVKEEERQLEKIRSGFVDVMLDPDIGLSKEIYNTNQMFINIVKLVKASKADSDRRKELYRDLKLFLQFGATPELGVQIFNYLREKHANCFAKDYVGTAKLVRDIFSELYNDEVVNEVQHEVLRKVFLGTKREVVTYYTFKNTGIQDKYKIAPEYCMPMQGMKQ